MEDPNQDTLQSMHTSIKDIQISVQNHMNHLEEHVEENTRSIRKITKTQHSIIIMLGDLTQRVAEIKNWSWLKIGAALSVVVPAVTILGLLVETLL